MSESNPRNGDAKDDVIRISHQEAMSGRVDDLLKRQLSLRGELGIGGDRRGRWYYRNWFVFMLAGAIAAFLAWVISEPFFDDFPYLQGEIEAMDADAPLPDILQNAATLPGKGWMEVNGQRVWFLNDTQWIGVQAESIDLADLESGQEVGVYVEALPMDSSFIALALFVDPSPPASKREKGSLGIARVAARTMFVNLTLFGLIAGLVGLAIGAADGLICRAMSRALLGGGIGLLVGVVGGVIFGVLGSLVYGLLSGLAQVGSGEGFRQLSTFGFVAQTASRAFAWMLAGMAMGLGQGIALRSMRLFLYGLLGGILGGLIGGLFFDPIDLLILGGNAPSAHISRLVGFTVIGGTVGAMIGVVELLARDAWLRMTKGPLAGKEFLIFKDAMQIGSSPRSEIYLFNDESVAPHHATLRAAGETAEIAQVHPESPVLLNGAPVTRARLRHGDQITIGATSFVYQTKKR